MAGTCECGNELSGSIIFHNIYTPPSPHPYALDAQPITYYVILNKLYDILTGNVLERNMCKFST